MKKEKDIFVESLLFSNPNIVKYSKENLVEVKPGIYAPIFVNLKQTLSEYNIRYTLGKKLAGIIDDGVDFICGMESGGTYYASVVADVLFKPLILFRKKNKECGNHDRIVGNLPPNGSKIAIIDDVIATGLAVSDAISYFQSIHCKVEVFSVFNYSPDKPKITFELPTLSLIFLELSSINFFAVQGSILSALHILKQKFSKILFPYSVWLTSG